MTRQPTLTPLPTHLPGGHSSDRSLNRAARVVVALRNSPHARPIQDAFRHQGWEVHVAYGDTDARRLVRQVRPLASVLCARPANGESGWLTCKKLLMERPALRVILVAANPTPEESRLAEFVGAAAYVGTAVPTAAVRAAMGLEYRSAN